MATNNSTLQNLRDDLDERISAAKTSGFWSQEFKDRAINDAGKQVCNAYRWGFIESALTTQTRDSKEYYDYPGAVDSQAMTDDSIYQINIEDEDYGTDDGRTRVSWVEFQKRKNSGDDSRLVFSNHDGFYFLYPIPEDGKVMSVFGLKKWLKLEDTDDVAITPPEFDDSIVKIALARCLRKAKKYSEAKAELVEVLDLQVGLLAQLWAQTHVESPGGYKGESVSSRW